MTRANRTSPSMAPWPVLWPPTLFRLIPLIGGWGRQPGSIMLAPTQHPGRCSCAQPSPLPPCTTNQCVGQAARADRTSQGTADQWCEAEEGQAPQHRSQHGTLAGVIGLGWLLSLQWWPGASASRGKRRTASRDWAVKWPWRAGSLCGP